MARVTVRVELRGKSNGDGYESLNRDMEAQGFTRLLRLPDGRRYHLPTGEYRLVGRQTRAQACRLAKAGAGNIADDAAILITEGSCSWYNLRGSPQ